jgi:hypothetical protein
MINHVFVVYLRPAPTTISHLVFAVIVYGDDMGAVAKL